MAEKEFDTDVIDALKKSLANDSAANSRDRSDRDLSGAIKSGFGWNKEEKQFFGENRPHITVNGLRSWINELVASYDRHPFTVSLSGVGDDAKNLFAKNVFSLPNVISDVIRNTAWDGYDYVLTYPDGNGGVFYRRINSRQVYVASCIDPTIKDCTLAAVVDVVPIRQITEMYGLEKFDIKGSDLFSDQAYNLVDDSDKNVALVTAFEVVKEGLRVSKIVKEIVLEQEVHPIGRVSLTRFFGEEVEIDKRTHYRGQCHFTADISKAINFFASDVQAGIAFKEDANWVAEGRAVAGLTKDWADHGINVRTYNGGTKDDPIQKPEPVNKTAYISEPLAAIDAFRKIEAETLGTVTTQSASNKTAEEVLSQNQSKEAAANMYMRHTQISLKEIAEITVQYLAAMNNEIDFSGYSVEISEGPIAANQRAKELQSVMMLYNIGKDSGIPNAGQVIFPEIIRLSEIEEDAKQRITNAITGAIKTPQQVMLEQQVAQMQQQLQAAGQESTELKSYVARLENMLNTEVYKVDADMQKAREKNAIELEKLAADVAMHDKDLGLKLAQLAEKSRADARKSAIDLSKSAPSVDNVIVEGNEADTRMGSYR